MSYTNCIAHIVHVWHTILHTLCMYVWISLVLCIFTVEEPIYVRVLGVRGKYHDVFGLSQSSIH